MVQAFKMYHVLKWSSESISAAFKSSLWQCQLAWHKLVVHTERKQEVHRVLSFCIYGNSSHVVHSHSPSVSVPMPVSITTAIHATQPCKSHSFSRKGLHPVSDKIVFGIPQLSLLVSSVMTLEAFSRTSHFIYDPSSFNLSSQLRKRICTIGQCSTNFALLVKQRAPVNRKDRLSLWSWGPVLEAQGIVKC